MTNPCVSLIIPVYNVRQYIKPCLDSVEQQTFRDFEVLLINDGSTDGSLDILLEYTNRNENFILIDQPNSGVSVARNNGIAKAKGEYLAFLDSDDILHPDYLKLLYEAACEKDADIVCCEYKYLFANGFKIKLFPGFWDTPSSKKAIKRLMLDVTVHHFCWNKLFKTSLFLENQIEFPIMRFEDVATIARAFYYAKRITFIPKAIYYYFQRNDSFLHKITFEGLQDYVNAMAILRVFYEQKEDYALYRAIVRSGYRSARRNILTQLFMMHLQTRKKGFWKNFKQIHEQFRLFDLPTLPVQGMPWEQLVHSAVFPPKSMHHSPTSPAIHMEVAEGADS